MDKAKKYLGEILEAIIIVAVLYTVFFQARVDGNSMENTLNDGDTIFVSRAAAFAGLYKNDDIIVFEHKKGNKNISLIKRIAASEGDKVEGRDEKLYINGKEKEGYKCEEEFEYILGKDEYFVLGDNADESTDSRVFGIIKSSQVKARAVIKVFPLNDIKILL